MGIDFTFYKEQYLGLLPQTLFDRFAPKAEAFLRFACGDRWLTDAALQQKKLALCAVTDEMEKLFRKGGIAAETAGEYAVHYQKGDDAAALYRAAQIYLPDEMLFRGCGV